MRCIGLLPKLLFTTYITCFHTHMPYPCMCISTTSLICSFSFFTHADLESASHHFTCVYLFWLLLISVKIQKAMDAQVNSLMDKLEEKTLDSELQTKVNCNVILISFILFLSYPLYKHLFQTTMVKYWAYYHK